MQHVDEEPEENAISLEALRRREPEAFAALVDRHQRVVLGLGQAMGLRGADLEDAAAEVFANVFRALPRFEGRSSIGTWVYRIACRTIPKVRSKLRPSGSEPIGDRSPDAGHATPHQQSVEAETNRQIWDAVERLEPREAMAIEMHYRRDWPVERIAGVLECPEGTVKTLLFRARQKLKTALARKEIGV